MHLAENLKIVPVGSDLDLNGGASVDCDSINMKNYHRATFIVSAQTLGGADAHIYLYSGATDAAKTTAITFRYAFGGAAQGTADCDVLSATTSTAGPLHLTNGTYDNYMLIIEADAAAMGAGHSWLTLAFQDTDTGATGNVSVTAVLEPRYTGNRSASALA